jgi:hypothetical protein
MSKFHRRDCLSAAVTPSLGAVPGKAQPLEVVEFEGVELRTGHKHRVERSIEPNNVSGAISGGYVPFARTKAERLASGDPRPSLEEPYGTHERYVEQVRAAATKPVKERFLFRDDAARLVLEAEESAVLK